MPFDDYDFRPITFQGVTFPATLMGIDILEPMLDIQDEGLWYLYNRPTPGEMARFQST